MLAARQFQQFQDWIERRDPRHSVLIRAKMRAGGLPVEVCIRNISSRGICVVSASPPATGTVVELTGVAMPIVGKVVWSGERRFGIAAGGKINVAAVLAQQGGGPAPHKLVPLPAYARAPIAVAQAAQKSRHTSNAMQFIVMAALGAAAALGIARIVYDNLSRTSDLIAAGFMSAQ
jgi:hypothetical protein